MLWIFLSHLHPHSPLFLESHYCRFHMSGHVVICLSGGAFHCLPPAIKPTGRSTLKLSKQPRAFAFVQISSTQQWGSERNGQLLSMSIRTGRTFLPHQIYPPSSFRKMCQSSNGRLGRATGVDLTVPQKWQQGDKPSPSAVLSPDTSSERNVRNTSVQQRKNRVERGKKRRRIIQLDRLVFWHVALKRTILPQKLGKCKLIFW